MKPWHWAWLVALAIGLAAGLSYSWAIAPVHPEGTTPDSLRADFKDQFRSAIAAAYAATGDLERAKARLALLADGDEVQALAAQAQRALAAGQPFGQAQQLALLGSDLQSGRSSIPSATTSPIAAATSSSTATLTPPSDLALTQAIATASMIVPSTVPSATITFLPALPSRTPHPSPSVPFKLVSDTDVCDASLAAGLLQVTVLDRDGHPLPGVEITITWEHGEERFFTGLQPEISEGYADYTMEPGTSYSLQIARLGVPVSGLNAPTCPGSDGQNFVGGLDLKFQEP